MSGECYGRFERFSVCPACGAVGHFGEVCPKCGEDMPRGAQQYGWLRVTLRPVYDTTKIGPIVAWEDREGARRPTREESFREAGPVVVPTPEPEPQVIRPTVPPARPWWRRW